MLLFYDFFHDTLAIAYESGKELIIERYYLHGGWHSIYPWNRHLTLEEFHSYLSRLSNSVEVIHYEP